MRVRSVARDGTWAESPRSEDGRWDETSLAGLPDVIPDKSRARCLTDDADGQELLDRMSAAAESGRCTGDFCEVCPFWAQRGPWGTCLQWIYLSALAGKKIAEAKHREAWRRRVADMEMEDTLR